MGRGDNLNTSTEAGCWAAHMGNSRAKRRREVTGRAQQADGALQRPGEHSEGMRLQEAAEQSHSLHSGRQDPSEVALSGAEFRGSQGLNQQWLAWREERVQKNTRGV